MLNTHVFMTLIHRGFQMKGDKIVRPCVRTQIKSNFRDDIEFIVAKYLVKTLDTPFTPLDVVDVLQEILNDRIKCMKAALDSLVKEKK